MQKNVNDVSNFYINRNDCIAESKTGILLKLNNKKVWINKKFVSKQEFCLTLRVGIIDSWSYDLADNEGKLTGKQIIELLSK